MKVLVLIPTKDTINPEALAAVYDQDYSDYSVLIHRKPPEKLDPVPEKNRVINIVKNRNEMRDMALASNAEYFLWVDSDTVIPKGALSAFMAEKRFELMGGWYHKALGNQWVAGNLKDGILNHFTEVQPQIVKSDLVGLGCMFMKRSLLRHISFDGGVNEILKDANGTLCFKGECLKFCEEARKLGVEGFMLPNVVCKHLKKL